MAAEFTGEGLGAALAAYRQFRRSSPRVRLAHLLLSAFLPVDRIAGELLSFDRAIGTYGAGSASRHALDRWGLSPRYDLSPEAWHALSYKPFVAFGNHDAGVEVAMFHSLFVRDDVRRLAAPMTGQVGPHMRELIMPLYDTRGPDLAAKGLRNRLLAKVETTLWSGTPDAREANRATLDRAARFVVQGGGVLLFPAGTMRSGSSWKPGLGRLVQIMSRLDRASDVNLVPMVFGVADGNVMSSQLFRRTPTRLLARLRSTWSAAPPYVYVSQVIPLASLDASRAAQDLTDELHARWTQVRAEARASVPEWPRSRAVMKAPRLAPRQVAG